MAGKRRTAVHARTGCTGARAIALLAALFALCFNALAAQTHAHPLIAAAGVGRSAEPAVAHASPAAEQTLCATCLVLAASGRSTLPAAATLPAQTRARLSAPEFGYTDAPPARSHTWRSRGPPLAL